MGAWACSPLGHAARELVYFRRAAIRGCTFVSIPVGTQDAHQIYMQLGLTTICGSYITSILGFKLSLLFSFLRIANDKGYKRAVLGIIICCTIFHIVFLMVQINLCTPVSLPKMKWNSSHPGNDAAG